MGNYFTLKRVSSYNYRRLYQPPENNFETYFGEGGGGVRKVDWVYSYSLQRYNLYNLPRDFSLTLPCHGQADVVFIGSFGGRKWRQMAPGWSLGTTRVLSSLKETCRFNWGLHVYILVGILSKQAKKKSN